MTSPSADEPRALLGCAFDALLSGEDAGLAVLHDHLAERSATHPLLRRIRQGHQQLQYELLGLLERREREAIYCDLVELIPRHPYSSQRADRYGLTRPSYRLPPTSTPDEQVAELLRLRRDFIARRVRELQQPTLLDRCPKKTAAAPWLAPVVAAWRAWGGSPRTPRLAVRAAVQLARHDAPMREIEARCDAAWSTAREAQLRCIIERLQRPPDWFHDV